jgi:hypothetical protein
MKKSKNFIVKLNWYGEVVEYYIHAISEKKALSNAIGRLVSKLRIKREVVHNYIMDPKQRRWEVVE